MKQPPFIFDPFSKPELEDVEIADVTFDKINEHFKIPVLNNSGRHIIVSIPEIERKTIMVLMLSLLNTPLWHSRPESCFHQGAAKKGRA